MANIIGMPRAAWRRQPEGTVEANPKFNNKMALLAKQQGIGFFDVFNRKFYNSITGSVTSKTTEYGTGVSIPSGTASVKGSFSYDRTVFDKTTLMIVYSDMGVISGFSGFFAMSTSTTTRLGLQGNNTSDDIAFYNNTTSGASKDNWMLNGVYNTSGLCVLIATINAGFVSGYMNGINVAPYTSVSQATGATDTISFGSERTTLAVGGIYYNFSMWNRVLEGDEIGLLSENPWQIFKPRIARFISIPSTGPVTFKPYWARPRSSILGSGV